MTASLLAAVARPPSPSSTSSTNLISGSETRKGPAPPSIARPAPAAGLVERRRSPPRTEQAFGPGSANRTPSARTVLVVGLSRSRRPGSACVLISSARQAPTRSSPHRQLPLESGRERNPGDLRSVQIPTRHENRRTRRQQQPATRMRCRPRWRPPVPGCRRMNRIDLRAGQNGEQQRPEERQKVDIHEFVPGNPATFPPTTPRVRSNQGDGCQSRIFETSQAKAAVPNSCCSRRDTLRWVHVRYLPGEVVDAPGCTMQQGQSARSGGSDARTSRRTSSPVGGLAAAASHRQPPGTTVPTTCGSETATGTIDPSSLRACDDTIRPRCDPRYGPHSAPR